MRIAAVAVLMVLAGSAAGQPAPGAGPPSKVLQRAIVKYDKGDFLSATIGFHSVISHETGDDPFNEARAQFFLAKALFQLKLHVPALAVFTTIAQTGASNPYYAITLKWLAALARVLPPSSGVGSAIATYPDDVVADAQLAEVRAELELLRGLSAYSNGELQPAIKYFAKVAGDAPERARASLAEGIAQLEAGDGAAALAALKRVGSNSAPARDLAALTLGRLALAAGQYDAAVAAYAAVRSARIDDALFESSLARAGKAGSLKALGGIEQMLETRWKGERAPDLNIPQAVASFDFCAGRSDAFAGFQADYKRLSSELSALLKNGSEDNAEFHDSLESGKLSPRLRALVRVLMTGPAEADTLALVAELETESALIGTFDPAWKTTAVAADALMEVELVKALAVSDAGKLMRARLQRLSSQLADLAKRTAGSKATAGDPTPVNVAIPKPVAGKPAPKPAPPRVYTLRLRRAACTKLKIARPAPIP